MGKINRQRVKDTFAEYTRNYNAEDPKIKLKIDHTYRVAALCQRIACSLELSEKDVDLAWLIGMLHDIGRFEQLRRFGTFSDAQSIDHAQFGVELLFENGLLEKFLPQYSVGSVKIGECPDEIRKKCQNQTDSDQASVGELIRTAIWNHSAYRIEKSLDKRTEMFCHILRDADKIDILKVNHDVPIEEIYNVTTRELYQSQVTSEVMDAFSQNHAVLRSLKKTPVDNIVGHAALVFELMYPVSYQIVREQGYLEKILGFASENPVTREQFEKLRQCMDKYMAGKI